MVVVVVVTPPRGGSLRLLVVDFLYCTVVSSWIAEFSNIFAHIYLVQKDSLTPLLDYSDSFEQASTLDTRALVTVTEKDRYHRSCT